MHTHMGTHRHTHVCTHRYTHTHVCTQTNTYKISKQTWFLITGSTCQRTYMLEVLVEVWGRLMVEESAS